jgi:DNA polymerase-3 subunit gamma/tau
LAYQVLARKYRPQTFADLIGQEAMVRTLANAFAADRIAHAFMLTGVRGVGKTTTARIIAKGAELHRPRRQGRPDHRSLRRLRTLPSPSPRIAAMST